MKYLFLLIALPFVCLSASENNALYKSIRDVPIIENGEPLVDIKDQTTIAYAVKFTLTNPECTKVRKTVYDKLCEAQKLLPPGIRFELNVGLRSLEIQGHLFDEMHKDIQKMHPQMNAEELFKETSKFVAPVITWEGVQNVPPHSTGGAFDIVLIDHEGHKVDMGIKEEDPFDEEIVRTDSNRISSEARKNRDIMGKALESVGFVNYPAEFWHWSYGDRRWAFQTNNSHSIYGPIAGNSSLAK